MSPHFQHEKDARAYREVQLEKRNYNFKEATLEWNSKGYFWKPKKKRKAKRAFDQNW